MIRFSTYIALFVLNIILYVLFTLINFDLIGSFVTLFYIVSTLSFIFSREEKPKGESNYKVPEAHLYQKSRVNIYGYLIITAGGTTAFLFYVGTTATSLGLGIASLLAWGIMIAFSFFAMTYSSKRIIFDVIADYVHFNMEEKISMSMINLVIRDFYEMQLSNKEELNIVKEKYEGVIEERYLEKIQKLFLKYIKETENLTEQVTSDEIKEINKKKNTPSSNS